MVTKREIEPAFSRDSIRKNLVVSCVYVLKKAYR